MSSRTRNAHTKRAKEKKRKKEATAAPGRYKTCLQTRQAKQKCGVLQSASFEAERMLINKCNAVVRTEACASYVERLLI
jgi:vacuolar-type H+-ATPase subunit E/Vma4